MSGLLNDDDVRQFRASGFCVLRDAFDPTPLADEMDRCFEEGLLSPETTIHFDDVEVRYLPMMSERTPVSVSLLDSLALPAAQLLGRRVLPLRAKGSRYVGDTAWHSDSTLDLPSIGFVAYLESLDETNGALCVRPGSHRADVAMSASELTLRTEPGDVIVFDEHLEHGSKGGMLRRQWRVDFVADPVNGYEDALVRSYFARIYQPDWDGGYDVDRYPSYDAYWHSTSPYCERLRDLGVFDLAEAQEDFVRRNRQT